MGWVPTEYNEPVMLALSEGRPELHRRTEGSVLNAVEGNAQVRENKAVQLASLALPVVELRPESRKMVNLEQIRKEVEASLPSYP